ncbi:MAG: four helix bundle protein [Candidatus Latescibacterota bacterium]|nr:MAG: four helix bundle protein [Candidatus Latescibacterota bacterium]
MNYEGWLRSLPEEIVANSLWKVEAYRLSLFVADVGWYDVTKLMQDKRMLALANQLYRALGSISANIAEGYSRGTGKDRARFYEYALGSARESRDWYYKSRHILSEPVTQHRLRLLTQVIRLLITMIPQQRGYVLREPSVSYQKDTPVTPERLDNLLQNVPLP